MSTTSTPEPRPLAALLDAVEEAVGDFDEAVGRGESGKSEGQALAELAYDLVARIKAGEAP